MKKQIFLSSILLWILWFCSFTQAQSLWDIELKFCDNFQEKQVDIVTNSDQDTTICVSYTNNSDSDATLNINFVDWAVNSSWWKSCWIPTNPNLNFWQYVQNYNPEVQIPAHWEVKKQYTIHYPAGYSWVSHGCITYDIQKSDDANEWGMINFVFRKTFSIDILVWGSEVKPQLVIKNLVITWDDASQQIILELSNEWNIDQDISLSWEIRNRFGYSQWFEIAATNIKAHQAMVLTSTALTMPTYKWLFFIKSNLKNTPIFNFDITNTNLEMEYSLPGTTIFSNTMILWNRIYMIAAAVIVLLLIFVIIKFTSNQIKKNNQK